MTQSRQLPEIHLIYPLSESAAYPGSDFSDMVLYLPYAENTPKRLWLYTDAQSPSIQIDDTAFAPVSPRAEGKRWIDFGVSGSTLISTEQGFGQVKFRGISGDHARDTYFVITTDINRRLNGSIEDAEMQLWGIRRRDAGRSALSPNLVRTGAPAVFHLFYTASESGLPAGGYLRFSIQRLFFETQSAGKDGCEGLEILHADVPLEFVSIEKDPFHQHYTHLDVIYRLPKGMPPQGMAHIRYATKKTMLCPLEYTETERRYWWSRLPMFAVGAAVDNRRIFVPLLPENSHTTRYVPGPQERLHLMLPGRIRQGEECCLTGIITDRLRNIGGHGRVLAFRLALEGTEERNIAGKDLHFTSANRFSCRLPALPPGVYRVKACDEQSGSEVAVSNPLEIIARDDPRPKIYWGEIHGHSGMSDGFGEFDRLFYYARDIAALDFAAAGDHACYFSDNQWKWMQNVVNSFNNPGRFVTLIGYEWAGKQGHRNIYAGGYDLELLRGFTASTRDFAAVRERFKRRNDIVIGLHGRHIGGSRNGYGGDIIRFFEIYSMWGIYEELAHKLLNGGAKMGFTGGGDNHDGRSAWSSEWKGMQGQFPHATTELGKYKCGLTGALMHELNRENLIKALRERKTYATTGARILLDFSISGISMGEEGAVQSVGVEIDVHACDMIAAIQVIRNGFSVKEFTGKETDMRIKWLDQDIPGGRHWYYLKVIQQDGETAWSSPVWVKRE